MTEIFSNEEGLNQNMEEKETKDDVVVAIICIKR